MGKKTSPFISKAKTLGALQAGLAKTSLSDDIKSSTNLPTLVILDDDPTGTQICHGINVLTVWDIQTLVEEFKSSKTGFFILTNSRALHNPEAQNLIREICEVVIAAARITGKEFEIVLRGDSTLRGHFPDEPEVAQETVGLVDAWILAPFFFQGGRLTIDDVHYVADGDDLVPAAQTPFAKDATFGYKNSSLRRYVEEKSKGRISPNEISSVSLEDIRVGGQRRRTWKSSCKDYFRVCPKHARPSNSQDRSDAIVTNKAGKRYIYRTGAAFLSTRLGIQQVPPISAASLGMDLTKDGPGGLIIAGSYVLKTTAQLESLIQGRGEELASIVLHIEKLLSSTAFAESIVKMAVEKAARLISSGKDVLVMTSRKLVAGDDGESSLKIGSVTATALVDFLRRLQPRPRYIIAKGGITSSDAATKGLNMKRAQIVGQAASGVPLWRCDEKTSKFMGIPYVVFPGNVGNHDTLLELVNG